MEEHISYASKLGAEYTELRSVSSSRTGIKISNRKIEEISSGINQGFCARVLVKGRWGCAFSNEENFKNLLEQAIQNAKSCQQSFDIDFQKPCKRNFKTSFQKYPKDVSLEEKKQALLSVDYKDYKNIVNFSINYLDLVGQQRFVNSEGSSFSWDDVITSFVCSAYSKKGERFENFYDIEAEHKGFELADRLPASSEYVLETCTQLLEAKKTKKGHFPAVIDPRLGGVFVHEAVGHCCEADLVLNNNSIFKEKSNEKIGPQHLNVYDDGSLKNAWGWTPFDSEGIPGTKTCLVEKGVLKNYLHSRSTAKMLDSVPTGNGRAQSLGHKAIPRMTNTFIGEGDSGFEEMLSGIKKGYYLKGSSGGQVDPSTGEFLFNAREAFWIENGEIKSRASSVSMIGNVLSTLNQISLIAKDLEFKGGGACGKSDQYVLTGEGSPHFMIEKVKIGGTD